MSMSRGSQPSSSRVAAIVAAMAVTLAVVLALASVRLDDDPFAGAMRHDDRGLMSGQGFGAGMMAVDEDDYLVEMIAHHREAITAAGELARSGRSEMRELGRSIVASQRAQVVGMRSWLERWHEDVAPSTYVPMMRDLVGLTGDDLDRAFLEDMVMHHRMAVMMSRHLAAGDVGLHREVATLADDIVREQTSEIRQMTRWLAQWFGGRAGMRMWMSR